MAETIPDLTDAQIEQLLSAAEVSLANSTPSDTAVAVRNTQQSLAVAATAPAAQVETAKVGQHTVKHSEELTLRVPRLRVKNKKVCHPIQPLRSLALLL